MDSQKILESLMFLIPMILSLSVHEYAHARSAAALGDYTAESMGRMTLNPIAHIDPIGTLVLPMMGFLFGGFFFGWAKPVPVNPLRFTREITMRKGMLLVAAAGPGSNMVLALLASGLIFVLVQVVGFYDSMIHTFFYIFIHLNVTLAFFNLIPVPPLDGGRILTGLLPERYDPIMQTIERFGFVLLIFLIFSNVLDILFRPARALSEFLLNWPMTTSLLM